MLGFPLLHNFINTCYFLSFFAIAILTRWRWYFTGVFICISLMISDGEHLFISLLAICISSLEKCLFRSSIFFNGLFFSILNCMISLYIGYQPLIGHHLHSSMHYAAFLFYLWFPLLCKSFKVSLGLTSLFLLLFTIPKEIDPKWNY